MFDVIDRILGLSLKAEDLGFGHMAARAVVMFIALIILGRLAKKRFLSNATVFDFILAVLIGSVAARAMTGDVPFFASLLGLLVLIAMHWTLSAAIRRSKSLGTLIEGHTNILIKDGVVDRSALDKAHMSMDDLHADLREKGVRHPGEVSEARLERNGKLSVLKK